MAALSLSHQYSSVCGLLESAIPGGSSETLLFLKADLQSAVPGNCSWSHLFLSSAVPRADPGVSCSWRPFLESAVPRVSHYSFVCGLGKDLHRQLQGCLLGARPLVSEFGEHSRESLCDFTIFANVLSQSQRDLTALFPYRLKSTKYSFLRAKQRKTQQQHLQVCYIFSDDSNYRQ